MNTQLAFAFGILAMVAIIMLVAIVVGIVKVIKHDKQFRNHHSDVNDCHRHISETERQIYQEINLDIIMGKSGELVMLMME